MSKEDLEIENVDRAERLLTGKFGELSNSLINNIEKIRVNLREYEADDRLLVRISDVMYEATLKEDLKDAEEVIQHLASTFWHQV